MLGKTTCIFPYIHIIKQRWKYSQSMRKKFYSSSLTTHAVFKVLDTKVASMKPSYDKLWQQVKAQKRLVMKLTWDLQAEQVLRKTTLSDPHPKIT